MIRDSKRKKVPDTGEKSPGEQITTKPHPKGMLSALACNWEPFLSPPSNSGTDLIFQKKPTIYDDHFAGPCGLRHWPNGNSGS
jgi:hypothetical protein